VTLHEHVAHPHVEHRRAHGPVRVVDQLDTRSTAARFNTWLAVVVTRAVGSMWCAYVFALLDLVSLPDAIRAGVAATVSWIAQTFLQLVLLSIIMVGQNVQAEAADKRSEATFKDTEALLYGQEQVALHLAVQDMVLRALAERFELDVDLPSLAQVLPGRPDQDAQLPA
jgi:ABC-type nickel/cobalt efflux system permease component RcnA